MAVLPTNANTVQVIFEKAEMGPFLIWLSAVTEYPDIERRPSPLLGTVTQVQKIINRRDTGVRALLGSIRESMWAGRRGCTPS